MLIIEGVTLIDGSGAAPLSDAQVVIADGHILHAGRPSSAYDEGAARRCRLPGRTIIPGLIEAHTHAHSDADMQAYIKNGVTTIRFAGLALETVRLLRRRIDAGEVIGPRIVNLGPMLDALPPAYPEWSVTVDTPVGAAEIADDLSSRPDVDGLIVTQRITDPLARAIIGAAHARGRRVVGQIWAMDAEAASRIGIDELHTPSRVFRSRHYPAERLLEYRTIAERLALSSRAWSSLDWDLTRPIMEDMVGHGVSYCGMQVILDFQVGVGVEELEADPDYLNHFGTVERQSFRDFAQRLHGTWTDEDREFARRANDMRREWMRRFRALGGILLAGTDMQFGGIMLHRELSNLQGLGMAPLEVIATATGVCGRVLGLPQGLVREGRPADLVILNQNPADDLSALRDIACVLKNGTAVWGDYPPEGRRLENDLAASSGAGPAGFTKQRSAPKRAP
jgi:enamidase